MSAADMLDIIIINWNTYQQLRTCLDSLCTNSLSSVASIIVVDNSEQEPSTDNALGNSQIQYILPEKNLGFGGGCNYGASQSDAPFILFLNPDIVFPEGCLDKLISIIESGDIPDRAGIIGAQLLNPDGTIQKNIARFPSFKHLFPRMLGLDRVFPKTFKSHYRKDLDYSQTQVVEQVPGAFFLVRRNAFKQLGGFDERFFLYFEDVDFSYRAHLAGWQTLYLADVSVQHTGGGTTQSIKIRRLYYSLRSRVLYVSKHFGRRKAYLIILGILFLEFPVRIIRSLFRISYQDLKNNFQALGLFLANLPEIVKKT
jgi:GT2 family glycosyltransferase